MKKTFKFLGLALLATGLMVACNNKPAEPAEDTVAIEEVVVEDTVVVDSVVAEEVVVETPAAKPAKKTNKVQEAAENAATNAVEAAGNQAVKKINTDAIDNQSKKRN